MASKLNVGVRMNSARARSIVLPMVVSILLATSSASQTMDEVAYFHDSITEKGDQSFVIRLSGGSSWLLAGRTAALVNTDVMIVKRKVIVDGQPVDAAWMYIAGEEIPAKHVEGLYPANAAYLTRVVAAEGQGATLRLADGSSVTVPRYDRRWSRRWVPPFKALLTGDRAYLYNLNDGRRVSVQPAK